MEIGHGKEAAAGIPGRNLSMGQASSVSAFVSRVRNSEMNIEINFPPSQEVSW